VAQPIWTDEGIEPCRSHAVSVQPP
jgi:hypothetical protein